MSNRLSLLVPGLLAPPQPLQGLSAEDKPAFKVLDRFFNRAKRDCFPGRDYYQTLFHLFGLETDPQIDPPVAALTRLADTGEQHTTWTLRCDPAYIHADMDRAVLMGHGGLGLNLEETERLLMILNAHVEQDGWQIEAHAVDRWYVTGSAKNSIRTTPPQAVLGQDIKHDLPRGQDTAYWCAMMNECQMLLHELPINIDRQERGLLPVNSLWFWGGGRLPETARCQFDGVFADDPLVTGLAMLAGCEHALREAIWQTMAKQEDQHYLLVLDALIAPQIHGDLFAWLDVVKQFEQNVINKLVNMLKQKRLAEVVLLSGDGNQFSLTAKQLRHWWIRQAGFSSVLEKATN